MKRKPSRKSLPYFPLKQKRHNMKEEDVIFLSFLHFRKSFHCKLQFLNLILSPSDTKTPFDLKISLKRFHNT